MKRQRYSQRQWRQFIRQQRTSGLGVKAFCRRQGLAPSTFFRWQRELGVPDGPVCGRSASTRRATVPARSEEGRSGGRAGFVELVARADRSNSGTGVADVAGASTAAAIELVLVNGLVVRVRPGFDPATLRQVVEALS